MADNTMLHDLHKAAAHVERDSARTLSVAIFAGRLPADFRSI